MAYRSQRGFTPADISLVFASYVGTLLPTLLLMSRTRVARRRRLVFVGLLLGALGLMCIAMAQGVPLMIAGRLLQGLAVGLSIGALMAAFAESYPGRLPPGTAVQVMATLGLGIGPLLSAVAFNLGGGLTLSYLPAILLTVGCFALVPRVPEPARAAAALATEYTRAADAALPPAVVWGSLRFAMPVLFTSWASLSIYLSLMPSYLATSLAAENPLIGAAAILAAQVASLSATLLFRRVPPERSGVVAPGVMIVGLVLLVLGTTYRMWALIALSTALVGGGAGVAGAAAYGIAERVAVGQRDRIFARMFTASYLGYSLPALTIGEMAARRGLTLGIGVVIGALVVIYGGTVGASGSLHRRRGLETLCRV